jgi:hypothetical protein
VITRQVVLLLTLAVLLFEADLLAQRTRSGSSIRRVFAVCALPLVATSGLIVYLRWHGLQ